MFFFSSHTSFSFQKSVPKHKGQILLFGMKVAHKTGPLKLIFLEKSMV